MNRVSGSRCHQYHLRNVLFTPSLWSVRYNTRWPLCSTLIRQVPSGRDNSVGVSNQELENPNTLIATDNPLWQRESRRISSNPYEASGAGTFATVLEITKMEMKRRHHSNLHPCNDLVYWVDKMNRSPFVVHLGLWNWDWRGLVISIVEACHPQK